MSKLERVSAAIERGKRPVPFRTRKLSLSSSMVLQGGPCGRVDRCRTLLKKGTATLVLLKYGSFFILFINKLFFAQQILENLFRFSFLGTFGND